MKEYTLTFKEQIWLSGFDKRNKAILKRLKAQKKLISTILDNHDTGRERTTCSFQEKQMPGSDQESGNKL